MPIKVRHAVFSLIFSLATSLTFAQHHNPISNSEFDQYVGQVSELSSRARANVYFANPQSLFRGVQVNFVNVGTGNLTFLRRDLVASGRIPLVFSRVYDSSGQSSADFGPGWTLPAAESITVVDHKAHLLTENGSMIDFVELDGSNFELEKDYPSDYLELRFVDSNTLQAKLRTGFIKQFQLVGNAFRLVKVIDRNGNELKLSYSNGLLNKMENDNHSITLIRTSKGRILSAQDDQNRRIEFAYDAQGRLIEADDLGGNAWTYSYYRDGKLKAAKDSLQRLNFGVSFDDDGRVRRLQLPSGIIQFNYAGATRSTTVLDRKALVSRFFQDEDGITTRVINPLGEETAIRLDNSRNVLSLSRDGSVIEEMEYDEQHRITARHSWTASGTVDRTYKYDPPSGQLSGILASDGKGQSFSYDANGNLTNAVLPEGVHAYGYSARGDLSAFTTPGTAISFSSDADGLIASMKEGKSDTTTMKYKAGGELDAVTFSDGKSVKYEFQPSGLRANLTYKDLRRVEYTYDPAGNLTSTKIFDIHGKQTAGQVLELDESYQLIKQTTFDGKIAKFAYDKNGNLTEIRQGSALTRFEYDSLNRLIGVIAADGRRITRDYKPGERSVVEEYQHAKAFMLDRRDTGLTFGASAEITASRPLTGLLGPVQFSESLTTFQLPNSSGDEIVTPEQAIEQPLEKLNMVAGGIPLQQRQGPFNRPFNPMFIPAEYASINCCPLCIIHPAFCANCDPNPPTDPSITIQLATGVAKGSTLTAQVSISPSSTVNLSLSTKVNTTGAASFDGGVTTKTITGTSASVIIHGDTASSAVNNITLTAVYPDTGDTLAQLTFSVVSVTLSLRNSGTVSTDNAAQTQFVTTTGSSDLGSIHGDTGVEIVGIVTPSGFAGTIIPQRSVLQGRGYRDISNGSTLTLTNDGASDNSDPSMTDPDPQSGQSGGKIYDLDEPGCSNSVSDPDGTICRIRVNFREWATLGGVQVSNDLLWFSRVSNKKANGADTKLSDVPGDNSAAQGSTSVTWNLQ